MSVKEKILRVLYERGVASWKEIFLETGVSAIHAVLISVIVFPFGDNEK